MGYELFLFSMIQAYERLLEFIGSDKAMANSVIQDQDTPAKS